MTNKFSKNLTVGVISIVVSMLSAYAQVSGPDDRPLTDPVSVSSVPNTYESKVELKDIYSTYSVEEPYWSPNGKDIAFSSNRSGNINIWRIAADGTKLKQLAKSDDEQYVSAWSPDGKWIVFEQDHGGDGTWKFFVVSSAGGPAVGITDLPNIRMFGARFAPDGKKFAFNFRLVDKSSFELGVFDWKTRAVTRLTDDTPAQFTWEAVAWSNDGKTLYANRISIDRSDADIFAINVADGAQRNLTSHQGKYVNLASSLSVDGKNLLITSTAQNGYKNVAVLSPVNNVTRWITNTKWEAKAGSFSSDGKTFSFSINADGVADTFIGDIRSLKFERINTGEGVNVPVGMTNSFSSNGRYLLLSRESSLTPTNFWSYDLITHRLRQITQTVSTGLRQARMPEMQLVHYRSFDGKMISALLWVPFNLQRNGKNPAIVLPHAGPTGQMRANWNPDVVALVSHGYICIAPNVRGSTGYGEEFQLANVKDLGGGDLRDEVAAIDFLNSTGYVDPKRIGITGQSYGGFLTLMAIGKYPDKWTAAVAQYGNVNWVTMFKNSNAMSRQYLVSLMGTPDENAALYTSSSPISYLDAITTPLLVLQGENDRTVPKDEAEQLVAQMTRKGKVVAVHYYPDEGHGFSKPEDQIDAAMRTIDWFDRFLKPDNTTAATKSNQATNN